MLEYGNINILAGLKRNLKRGSLVEARKYNLADITHEDADRITDILYVTIENCGMKYDGGASDPYVPFEGKEPEPELAEIIAIMVKAGNETMDEEGVVEGINEVIAEEAGEHAESVKGFFKYMGILPSVDSANQNRQPLSEEDRLLLSRATEIIDAAKMQEEPGVALVAQALEYAIAKHLEEQREQTRGGPSKP